MGTHQATVEWRRGDAAFSEGRYSRRHEWRFDGGAVVAASPSPEIVPAPWSDAAAVDPEEAFVAAVASCHMMWFLSIAAERGFVVDRYEDAAVGTMSRIAPGRQAITDIALRPRITFAGDRVVAPAEVEALHEAAHERCFIANSVKTAIRVEPHAARGEGDGA